MNSYMKSIQTALVCLVVIFAALFGHKDPAKAQQFWIHEHVALTDDVITLGDIAEPKTAKGRERWPKVRDIQLWRAPLAGQRIVLSRSQVMERLTAVDQEVARHSVIPREIIFQRGARVYSREELASMVTDYLLPQMRGLGEEIEFRDFRVPAPVFLENAYDKIEIQTLSDPLPGRISLRINIIDAHGSVSRRLTGNVFADVWATVACAARPLNRGDIVNPGDVRFEKKNLAYLRDEVWEGRTGPWRVRSSIGQGQPILKRALDAVPVISRGDMATLIYQGSLVTLSVPVQVLEDGQKGDTVMVRNLSSRKEISGTVQDSGTVVAR